MKFEKLDIPALPPQYVPYSTVDLCSNTLLEVPAWMIITGFAPLLVGRGDAGPRVWLYAPLRREDRWQPIVEDNEIISKAVGPYRSVELGIGPDGRQVALDIGGFPVLRCEELRSDELAVRLIDLAPLGLVINGTSETGVYLGPYNTRNETYRQFAFGTY